MGAAQSLARSSVDVQTYLRHARTGDLILWSSNGTEATLVKFATGSFYSHIGIVLVLDAPLHPKDSGVYLYHSPSDAIPGLVDRFSDPPRRKGGPQLNDLGNALYVCRHAKSIEVRRFRVENADHPWASGVLATDRSETVAFARKEHTKRYEQNTLELWRSAYDGPLGANTEDLSSYFCSELVAELLKQAGVIVTELPSNEFTPADFSSAGVLVPELPSDESAPADPRDAHLARGFAWSREIRIVHEEARRRRRRQYDDVSAVSRSYAGAGAAPPPPPQHRSGVAQWAPARVPRLLTLDPPPRGFGAPPVAGSRIATLSLPPPP
jgi:hypothetical protein